ncbi:DUF4222 domain-containing protein [Escherichia coli]|nr:DUF4222 domain-containing protein [Escherichia coli]
MRQVNRWFKDHYGVPVRVIRWEPETQRVNQAYHQMVKLGIVEQRERYSRTTINNIKNSGR